MSHDFDDKHGGQGGHCNNQGIMSYGSYSFNKWSTCSRSDFEQHYASRNWGNGCLDDISGGPNPGEFTPVNTNMHDKQKVFKL